jgi:hypothetical protein
MKNCFIRLSVVFSLFMNLSPSYAMWQEGEVLDYNHTSHTARYFCQNSNAIPEDTIFPAYVYPGMLYVAGVATPFVMTALKKRWDAYWYVRAAAEFVEPGIQTTPQPQESTSDNAQPVVSLVSSADESGPEVDGTASAK